MASLISQGIDMTEAKARVDNLTDSEIISLADQIETAPAGGGAIGIIVGAAVVVIIVLVITDILGFTDVFAFINKLLGLVYGQIKKRLSFETSVMQFRAICVLFFEIPPRTVASRSPENRCRPTGPFSDHRPGGRSTPHN